VQRINSILFQQEKLKSLHAQVEQLFQHDIKATLNKLQMQGSNKNSFEVDPASAMKFSNVKLLKFFESIRQKIDWLDSLSVWVHHSQRQHRSKSLLGTLSRASAANPYAKYLSNLSHRSLYSNHTLEMPNAQPFQRLTMENLEALDKKNQSLDAHDLNISGMQPWFYKTQRLLQTHRQNQSLIMPSTDNLSLIRAQNPVQRVQPTQAVDPVKLPGLNGIQSVLGKRTWHRRFNNTAPNSVQELVTAPPANLRVPSNF